MPTMGETDLFPVVASAPFRVGGAVKILIGAAGAVTSTTGMPGVSAVRTGAGVYNLTFNRSVDVILNYGIQKSATVFDIKGSAIAPTAGTATFGTFNVAGAATDPASTDELTVMFWCRTKGAY